MSQPSVLFQLKCQKFIEMVCSCAHPIFMLNFSYKFHKFQWLSNSCIKPQFRKSVAKSALRFRQLGDVKCVINPKVRISKSTVQIKSGDDEATMSYGRSELSEFDAESEEDKQHLKVNCIDHCKSLNGVGL